MTVNRPAVLIVDDEVNVLSAIQRLLRNEFYDVLVANSGEEALAMLFDRPVDLIISDQRMPGMTGSELLAKVKDKHPDTLRMILTGYQDISAAIAAINEGGAYQFLQKPWEDESLKLHIRQALAQRLLVRENVRLHEVLEQQNEQLKDMNLNLERIVMERTAHAEEKATEAARSYAMLQSTFDDMIEVFAGLINLRDSSAGAHARHVKSISEYICRRLELEESEITQINAAALLHDIGKIGVPESILYKEPKDLVESERQMLMAHTIHGQVILEEVDGLRGIGRIIRSHHEHWDGTGFPDRLEGKEIPLGARIIAAANHYDNRSGQQSALEAKQWIEMNSGILFDPQIAHYISEYYRLHDSQFEEYEITGLSPAKLKSGMLLARDVFGPAGMLLLCSGETLKEGTVEKLQRLNAKNPFQDPIFVYLKKDLVEPRTKESKQPDKS